MSGGAGNRRLSPAARKAVPAELSRTRGRLSRLGLAPRRCLKPGDDHAATGTDPIIRVLAENILRVDAERIDSVLNLVGELIIGKSMLQQALNEFAKHVSQGSLARHASPMPWPSRRACSTICSAR